MLKLVGGLTIGSKTFSNADSIGAAPVENYIKDDTWYGGNVKSFLRTNEGFLLCRDKRDNIINIAYDVSMLTDEWKRMLDLEAEIEEIIASGIETNIEYVVKENKIAVESLNRKEMIQMAKELGVEGKIATMSSNELISKIKELMK